MVQVSSNKDMGKYDGWTCLAIVFSHVIFGGFGSEGLLIFLSD